MSKTSKLSYNLRGVNNSYHITGTNNSYHITLTICMRLLDALLLTSMHSSSKPYDSYERPNYCCDRGVCNNQESQQLCTVVLQISVNRLEQLPCPNHPIRRSHIEAVSSEATVTDNYLHNSVQTISQRTSRGSASVPSNRSSMESERPEIRFSTSTVGVPSPLSTLSSLAPRIEQLLTARRTCTSPTQAAARFPPFHNSANNPSVHVWQQLQQASRDQRDDTVRTNWKHAASPWPSSNKPSNEPLDPDLQRLPKFHSTPVAVASQLQSGSVAKFHPAPVAVAPQLQSGSVGAPARIGSGTSETPCASKRLPAAWSAVESRMQIGGLDASRVQVTSSASATMFGGLPDVPATPLGMSLVAVHVALLSHSSLQTSSESASDAGSISLPCLPQVRHAYTTRVQKTTRVPYDR